jgi:hypothetical protein
MECQDTVHAWMVEITRGYAIQNTNSLSSGLVNLTSNKVKRSFATRIKSRNNERNVLSHFLEGTTNAMLRYSHELALLMLIQSYLIASYL